MKIVLPIMSMMIAAVYYMIVIKMLIKVGVGLRAVLQQHLGNALNFLKENMDVKIMVYEGRILGVDLPNTVELTVVETDPGIRGDTATGGSKPAKMDTGYVVKVPLFINEGDVLRIDTRTGEYIERA